MKALKNLLAMALLLVVALSAMAQDAENVTQKKRKPADFEGIWQRVGRSVISGTGAPITVFIPFYKVLMPDGKFSNLNIYRELGMYSFISTSGTWKIGKQGELIEKIETSAFSKQSVGTVNTLYIEWKRDNLISLSYKVGDRTYSEEWVKLSTEYSPNLEGTFRKEAVDPAKKDL